MKIKRRQIKEIEREAEGGSEREGGREREECI